MTFELVCEVQLDLPERETEKGILGRRDNMRKGQGDRTERSRKAGQATPRGQQGI